MFNSDERAIKKLLGDDLFRRIISSILLAQAEIIRTSGLPFGGSFILFKKDRILWSLTGENISSDGLKLFLNRKDLKDIKSNAISNLKKGQKISGKDLRKINIVHGADQFIEIRISNKKYTEPNPVIKGPNGTNSIAEIIEDDVVEILPDKKKYNFADWSLSLLIYIRIYLLNLFRRKS